MAIWRGAGGSGDATTDAANEASVASTKAAEAEASATAAASSATSAATSATSASSSASSASTDASAAAASALAAANSETAAASSETNAAASEAAASTSETNAATSETNAAASESAAATSESNAATSAATAAAQAAAALAAFDDFDDKYLGAKASDPATDNDGDPLAAGMLYFNTASGVMNVYTGSSWVAAYVSAAGVLLQANNLSDVASALTSRANLGLTIGTDVQAHSAVLDATTASYTTAEETKLAGIETGADVTDVTNVTAAGALMDSEVTNLAQVKAFSSADYATAAQGTLADSALQSSDIGVTVQGYDATIVVDADIGSTVQAYDADTAKTDVAQTFTASQRGTVTSDNDLSFDLSATNNFSCTPTGTGTLTFTNHTSGQSGFILLDNSGGHAITAAATTKINATDLTTISTAGVYVLSYFDNGTNAYIMVSRSFA